MGGKALNKYQVFTDRKSNDDYNRIATIIQNQLSDDFFDKIKTSVVKCYHDKNDHGDLDLLISVDLHVNWREYITHMFKPNAINTNGNVISFDYENFQVDFIFINNEYWDVANTYFSYDPLGNIMGKIYHKFGLSYGWNGLYYKYRNFNGRYSKDILISSDVRKIFEFGGFDYDRYLLGFDKLEDIFEYAISSKYFNHEILTMENLSHIDKKRNRKRKSYHIFLNYINENKIQNKHEFDSNKSNYVNQIVKYFPEADLLSKISEFDTIDKQNQVIKQKFNGDMVMLWLPKLNGNELGIAIGKFKENLGDGFADFILNNPYDVIKSTFLSQYNEFIEQK